MLHKSFRCDFSYADAVAADFVADVENGKRAVVRIHANNGTAFNVHRSALVMCPYMRKILSSSLCCEGSCIESAQITPEIFLPDVSEKTLKIAVRFIHTGVLSGDLSKMTEILSVLETVFGFAKYLSVAPINDNVEEGTPTDPSVIQCPLVCAQRGLTKETLFKHVKEEIHCAMMNVTNDRESKCVVCRVQVAAIQGEAYSTTIENHYINHQKRLSSLLFELTGCRTEHFMNESAVITPIPSTLNNRPMEVKSPNLVEPAKTKQVLPNNHERKSHNSSLLGAISKTSSKLHSSQSSSSSAISHSSKLKLSKLKTVDSDTSSEGEECHFPGNPRIPLNTSKEKPTKKRSKRVMSKAIISSSDDEMPVKKKHRLSRSKKKREEKIKSAPLQNALQTISPRPSTSASPNFTPFGVVYKTKEHAIAEDLTSDVSDQSNDDNRLVASKQSLTDVLSKTNRKQEPLSTNINQDGDTDENVPF